MNTHQRGVTLIELMIVVTIVSILAAIAYPSYRSQLVRSHRAEGKAALVQIQVAQEKYFLQNNRYGTLAQLSPNALGLVTSGSNVNTANGYYRITVTPASPTTSFTATATALSSQADDSPCTTLTIDQSGQRTPTSGCW